MNWKKIFAALLTAVLCAIICLPASAEEWKNEEFSFTVPEEIVYTFSPAVLQEDPSWALAGIADPSAMLKEYREMGVLTDLYTEGRKCNLKVLSKSNNTTETIFNLRDMPEEEKSQFLDKLAQAETEGVTVEKSYVDFGGQPFYRIQIDSVTSMGEIHELQYGTIFNGHTLTFVTYSEKALSEEQAALLEKAASSFQILQLLEKPEPKPLNLALMLALLVVLVVVVVAPFIYIPVRNRQEKKRKAEMAERLSAYHKAHENGSGYGEVRFVNETDCTREAVQTFSRYHAYGKNLASLLIGGLLCASVLALAFTFDVTWWMKLAAVAVAVYFLYRAINMGTAVEKVQQKVFGRGVSSTARYTFFDEGFRVAGIQSASVYPYFQITTVRKHGHYLYLYYSQDNAYPVDQFGFTQGEFEEFSRFISEKTAKSKKA